MVGERIVTPSPTSHTRSDEFQVCRRESLNFGVRLCVHCRRACTRANNFQSDSSSQPSIAHSCRPPSHSAPIRRAFCHSFAFLHAVRCCGRVCPHQQTLSTLEPDGGLRVSASLLDAHCLVCCTALCVIVLRPSMSDGRPHEASGFDACRIVSERLGRIATHQGIAARLRAAHC